MGFMCFMEFDQKRITVFAEINAHPEISAHQKQWLFKGGSTQNQWLLMSDFSKGGVHKTDESWWVIFKGGSTQNRWVLMGEFSKGGVHKTNGFWWVLEFFLASKS